jgi:diadenosine tetraphosphate (Ap4A) HIT family hydrolase
MRDCDFCKISKIKSRLVWEGNGLRVILTHTPIVPGHLLILPVRHAQTISDLTKRELDAIFRVIPKLRVIMKNIFKAQGFNFAWNEGMLAGQSINHLHLHMLPRKAGDMGITQYEPRKFLYRPGARKISSRDEIKSLAKLFKDEIKKQK